MMAAVIIRGDSVSAPACGQQADAVKKCSLCTVACENNADNYVSMMIREKRVDPCLDDAVPATSVDAFHSYFLIIVTQEGDRLR